MSRNDTMTNLGKILRKCSQEVTLTATRPVLLMPTLLVSFLIIRWLSLLTPAFCFPSTLGPFTVFAVADAFNFCLLVFPSSCCLPFLEEVSFAVASPADSALFDDGIEETAFKPQVLLIDLWSSEASGGLVVFGDTLAATTWQFPALEWIRDLEAACFGELAHLIDEMLDLTLVDEA